MTTEQTQMMRPPLYSPVAEMNFISEVRDLAAFYESWIRLPWQDALQTLIDQIEEEQNDAV